jgi:hypothetical protein
MFKKLVLPIIALLIVGCTQTPDGKVSTTVNASAPKVGYLVNVRTYPTHTHVGTTALTNFTKSYPFQWKIPTYIEKQLSQRLKQFAGVNPINLRGKGIKPSEVNGLLKNINGKWMVARGKKNAYLNLIKRLGLSAIVIINESTKPAINDCGMLGCKTIKAKGYGLLTHSFVNTNKFFSATAFYVHIYKLKKLDSLDSKLNAINKSQKMTLVALSKGSTVQPNKIDFIYPKQFNEWTEKEFKPFRTPLLSYINGMTQKVSTVLGDTEL